MPDSDTQTQATAELDRALAAVTAPLPGVDDALVPYHEASGEERKEIEALIAQIDIKDTARSSTTAPRRSSSSPPSPIRCWRECATRTSARRAMH